MILQTFLLQSKKHCCLQGICMSNTRDATKSNYFPFRKTRVHPRVKIRVAFLTTWSVLRRFTASDYTFVVSPKFFCGTFSDECIQLSSQQIFSTKRNESDTKYNYKTLYVIQNTTIKHYIIQKTRRRKSNINQTQCSEMINFPVPFLTSVMNCRNLNIQTVNIPQY